MPSPGEARTDDDDVVVGVLAHTVHHFLSRGVTAR
jgi:hypothetical protein